MTVVSCQEVADVADELALDALAGDARAAALEHLEGCANCRAIVEALSETADQLLSANPALQPPAGFEYRVLARFAADQTTPRRRPRRALALVAAAAAVVALVGGVTTIATRAGHHDPTVVGGERELRTVQLISAYGQIVGDVTTYPGRPAWLFMRVEGGIPSTTYQCVLDIAGRPPLTIGSLAVTHGKGAWGEHLTIDTQVRSARLVSTAGATIATATFPQAGSSAGAHRDN